MSADSGTQRSSDRFRLGINYWPARTAMGWWTSFDRSEVADDFQRIAVAGFDSVRIFLTWEDFQPAPDRVAAEMLRRLVAVVDIAGQVGLEVMATLFTGHMSGANWIPAWALGGSGGDQRFRVISGGRVTVAGLRNWYADPGVAQAQALLGGKAAEALAGHPAAWAWDLGNENSNCVTPPTRTAGRDWLERITTAIRTSDSAALVTIGLHMEDLEEDRKLGPGEAGEVCDFLTMHGYPIYARWVDGPTDEALLPFLAHVTRWLGGGGDVLFTEFGLPTYRVGHGEGGGRHSSFPLTEEQAAAGYIDRALRALHLAGCTGAMLWCYTDYAPATWKDPPLDLAEHERSFGLWRADGSPKPAAATMAAFTGVARVEPAACEWIDVGTDEFSTDPGAQLERLYRRFKESESG